MDHSIQLLDVVALTETLPGRNLVRGQVGTVVEIFSPDAFLVEFSDEDGEAYAMPVLRADHLLVLKYSPAPSPTKLTT